MPFWTEFPNVPRAPFEPDHRQARRLNLIAALVLALLGLGLALSPGPAGRDVAVTANYGD